MDIRGIVKEVGYFETARNLRSISGSSEAAVRVSSDMPMPPEDAEDMLQRCADMILERKKKKVFFLTPEIALIEKLAACPGSVETVLIALSSDLDEDMCSRIGNNLMKNMDIRLIREPFFPEDLYPKDGRKDNGIPGSLPHDGALRGIPGAEDISPLCHSGVCRALRRLAGNFSGPFQCHSRERGG